MPEKTIHFALALHAHQPTGNFDHVFQEAFERCYAPFLEELSAHPDLPFTLHYSGILLEWLEEHQPAYLDKLREMVGRGQVELIGGGFGEPILVMLSDRDRHGQLRKMSDYIESRFGEAPRGAWITERVWEQCLASDLAAAGLEYAMVDDSHFRLSGLRDEELLHSYTTEDRGRTICIFPLSEALRYHIPFRTVPETIDYLRSVATEEGERLIVYGDDTEKFGSWPGTHQHVYKKGWLARFFKALEENRSWLRLVKLGDALSLPAREKVYLPDSSYREMTEWALPTRARQEFEELRKKMGEELAAEAAPFFRGGAWRTFLAKYPESGEMYGRMMDVSRRVASLPDGSDAKREAELELYRGQCNCAYWHGVFGGLYLPHLRSAVYSKLIAAEKIADGVARRGERWSEAERIDFDFDGAPEVRLSSDRTVLFLQPHRGGRIVEIDDRKREFNLLATMTRRREAYHRDVRADVRQGEGEDVASIHDKVTSKVQGLEKLLVYDPHRRVSLIDHFFPREATLERLAACEPVDAGDFAEGVYEAELPEGEKNAHVRLVRKGIVRAAGSALPVRVKKDVILPAGEDVVHIAYRIRNEGEERLEILFSVELAHALLAGNAPDRRLLRDEEEVGPLASQLDLKPCRFVGARDGWLDWKVGFRFDQEAPVWTLPVRTVSLSEGGYESVYQSTIFLPRWALSLGSGEEWAVRIDQTSAPAAGSE